MTIYLLYAVYVQRNTCFCGYIHLIIFLEYPISFQTRGIKKQEIIEYPIKIVDVT